VARGAGSISKTAGDRPGGPAGDLCELIADRLRGDASAEKALAEAQAKPDSKIKQTALQAAIAGKMEEDADFAEEIRRLVETIKKEGAVSSVFDQRKQKVNGPQTNINETNAPVISGNTNIINLIQDVQKEDLIPNQIPQAPKEFSGRDTELKDLKKTFCEGSTVICLQGMAGVGKSALALALAQEVKDNYPEGQIFINLMGTEENPLSSANAMAQAIRAFRGPEYKIPENESELAGIYRSILANKRALLLLDNAASRGQVEPLLPEKSCCVLITSRKKFALAGRNCTAIHPMSPREACELLLKIA